MESVVTRALEGQPLLVIALIVAIVFLWRDLQKEREARVNMQRDLLNTTNAVSTALGHLTDAIKNGRG